MNETNINDFENLNDFPEIEDTDSIATNMDDDSDDDTPKNALLKAEYQLNFDFTSLARIEFAKMFASYNEKQQAQFIDELNKEFKECEKAGHSIMNAGDVIRVVELIK